MTGPASAQLIVRRATAGDGEALLALSRRLAAFDLPPWRRPEEVAGADGRAMLAAVQAAGRDDEVFLAERAGTAAGCLHVHTATDFFGLRHAHISVIATSAEAEGTGVARALMAHAERWARARRLPLVTLNVFAANTRARRFYERAGYAPEVVKYAKPLDD